MKKINLALLYCILLFIFSAFSYAQFCDYSPECFPKSRACGCGGIQTRYTLCSGGCAPWYPCNATDAETLCANSADDDCDGFIDCRDSDCSSNDFCIDADSDSYTSDVDCDDANPLIHPGGAEVCNNLDDDCDGRIDEDISRECGVSNIGICRLGIESCYYGAWSGCTAVLPGRELCDDLDNNCDGTVDEGCSCRSGDTKQCGSDIGACEFGTQSCVSGSWSSCVGSIIPKDEICVNEIDDDCDGVADDGCAAPVAAPTETPPAPTPVPAPEEPTSIAPVAQPVSQSVNRCVDTDGDTYGTNCAKGPDCDDNDAAINPASVEICNNIDDDCSDVIDDGISRECGTSGLGICRLGTERCVAGSWVGCTAIFPKEEVCGNGIDDDCNGIFDESCDQPLSENELALKQFLDLEFGKDNYDFNHYLESSRKTANFVTTQKTSEAKDGKTTISIVITPIQTLKNVTIFEYIPKFIADSADRIVFKVQPEVIQSDPLVAWHFAELTGRTDLSYEVAGEVDGAAAKTSTVVFAEESSPLERPWYFDMIPLVIIPLLGLVFIVMVELAHHKRK